MPPWVIDVIYGRVEVSDVMGKRPVMMGKRLVM